MAQDYDTAEIRMTARRIRDAAREVNELSTKNVASILSALVPGFQGMAADALNEQLQTIRSDISRLSQGLDNVHLELMEFAQRLDEADHRLAQEIIGK